jgi:hypothetical protein
MTPMWQQPNSKRRRYPVRSTNRTRYTVTQKTIILGELSNVSY